jgi:hypothetical protein
MEVGPGTSSTAEMQDNLQPKVAEFRCKSLFIWRCLVKTLGLLYFCHLWYFCHHQHKYQQRTLKQIDCMQLPEGLWKSKLLRQWCRWKISSALSCTHESSVVLYPFKRSTHRPSELRRKKHKFHKLSSCRPFFLIRKKIDKKSLKSGRQRSSWYNMRL